jgi:hypothetical protein
MDRSRALVTKFIVTGYAAAARACAGGTHRFGMRFGEHACGCAAVAAAPAAAHSCRLTAGLRADARIKPIRLQLFTD